MNHTHANFVRSIYNLKLLHSDSLMELLLFEQNFQPHLKAKVFWNFTRMESVSMSWRYDKKKERHTAHTTFLWWDCDDWFGISARIGAD